MFIKSLLECEEPLMYVPNCETKSQDEEEKLPGWQQQCSVGEIWSQLFNYFMVDHGWQLRTNLFAL